MSDPRRFDLDPDTLAFDAASGLLPAIVQAPDGRVLMLGWMSREAVARTLETGRVTFFSRSRSRLWEKGETSGHWLELESLATDCDRDALLVSARPHGPTCHTGRRSCFDPGIEAESRTRVEAEIAASPGPPGALGSALDRLYSRVARRAEERCGGSYTAALLDAGTARIAQKLGEEGVETAIAAVQGDGRLVEESVDLLYHLLVLWRSRGVLASDVAAEITRREDES